MRIAVTFPWRPTPDRIRAFDFVTAWYQARLPQAEQFPCDTDHAEFNRAAARNACVRAAEAAAADVVVVNDADTIPDVWALNKAIVAASRDYRLHFGLSTMSYLDEEQTEAVYRGAWPRLNGRPHDSSVLVIQPAAWWRAGGQDERFHGYGGEDGAFTSACNAMLGEPIWHPGNALSLWHDGSCRDIGSERWQPNSDLASRYLAARYDRTAMQALIAERDAA